MTDLDLPVKQIPSAPSLSRLLGLQESNQPNDELIHLAAVQRITQDAKKLEHLQRAVQMISSLGCESAKGSEIFDFLEQFIKTANQEKMALKALQVLALSIEPLASPKDAQRIFSEALACNAALRTTIEVMAAPLSRQRPRP